MANPILPSWEYIPDGEPRVFGDRVYLYGSHDRPNSEFFCDYKVKVWSASVDDLNHWTCHGHSFHTRPDRDHEADVDWSDKELYAPDVVEKDGKYYMYSYIVASDGCVSVSDRPEGPFKVLSRYKYSEGHSRDNGVFNDPGTLVDDDGRVYISCGFEGNYMAELNGDNMYEVIDGSHQVDVIGPDEPFSFFEASSPRKVGDTYYMIYSPKPPRCSQLVYATAKSPLGPYTYRGVIIDNAVDYPFGNDHGSICCIKGKWYVFYHRMSNNSQMSRRACVEPIEILEDGSILQVESTSLGFEKSLNPYEMTSAEIACILTGGCFVTERNLFERTVTSISNKCVMGYKYFDFGQDYASKTMKLAMKIRGLGAKSCVKVIIDDPIKGKVIGQVEIGTGDGIYEGILEAVTGRHALYFVVEHAYKNPEEWVMGNFRDRLLFELDQFVFLK